MKINFITNNYMTVWNLLYGSSISLKMHALKQKLWITYNKEYKRIEHDKDEILCDIKNFIPDDNTLYDLFDGGEIFSKIEVSIDKHRNSLLKLWDTYKKDINKELNDILRVKIDDFNVIVMYPSMDSSLSTSCSNNVAWGCKHDLDDGLLTILSIIELSLKCKNKYQELADRKIFESIIHMAVVNEVYTRMNVSNYKSNSLNSKLDKTLYPYFLMYMGLDIEDMPGFMMRDNMPFDINKYKKIDKLCELNIFEFIDYIISNKKDIVV